MVSKLSTDNINSELIKVDFTFLPSLPISCLLSLFRSSLSLILPAPLELSLFFPGHMHAHTQTALFEKSQHSMFALHEIQSHIILSDTRIHARRLAYPLPLCSTLPRPRKQDYLLLQRRCPRPPGISCARVHVYIHTYMSICRALSEIAALSVCSFFYS